MVGSRSADASPRVRAGIGAPSFAALLLLALFAVVLVRTAWLSDDAYITFRTVDNLLSGYGPRWNAGERVQAYTHPLWMLLLAAATFVIREPYYSSLALSFACTLGALILYARRIAPSPPAAIVGLTILLFSQAFVDFSTSGLENPLTHLLLVAFLSTYWQGVRSPRAIGVLSAIAGLVMLNRLDAGLIVLPPFCQVVLRNVLKPDATGASRERPITAAIVGLFPLIAWELFSLLYYGFPFPNTAYAKLKTGIPSSDLMRQGLVYLQDSLARDPITLAAIAVGTLGPLFVARTRAWPVVLGVLLHVLYVVRIGGDFMSGRFLTPALMASVCLLTRFAPPMMTRWWPLPLAAVLVVGNLSPPRPLFSGPDYGQGAWQRISLAGIADERRYYYPASGLLRTHGRFSTPDTDEPERVERYLSKGQRVVPRDMVGFFGAAARRRLHVVDVLGLGDPLMARLPAQRPWRIGHFYRPIPDGYLETLEEGTNRIRDPDLAAYYETLRLITQGPLWSGARLTAIVEMNLGLKDHLLRDGL